MDQHLTSSIPAAVMAAGEAAPVAPMPRACEGCRAFRRHPLSKDGRARLAWRVSGTCLAGER